MLFGRAAKPDINAVGGMLTNLGLGHRFDEDGDITFVMRLPGERTRESDGSSDWNPLRYTVHPDFSIVGEFTDLGDYTDMAKRMVRIHLIGSDLSSGVLRFQAFPKVVPSKFERSARIDVIARRDEADAFNRAGTGLQATHFADGSFGVTGAAEGRASEDALRTIIGSLSTSAGRFMQTRFTGFMVAAPA